MNDQNVVNKIEEMNNRSRFRIWYKRVFDHYKSLPNFTEPREAFEMSIEAVASRVGVSVSYVCQCMKYPDILKPDSKNQIPETRFQKPKRCEDETVCREYD